MKYFFIKRLCINIIFILLLLPTALAPTTAYADTMIIVETNADNLTTNSFCSLREAITNANNDNGVYTDCEAGSGNDTIVFSNGLAGLTVTLTSSLPEINDTDGLTIIGLPFTAEGEFAITISGNNLYRVFFNVAPLTLDTLIVKNGRSTFGAGVYSGSILNITNSKFLGNNASEFSGFGGAVFNVEGTLTISNSTFSGNGANGAGGAVFNNFGTVIISNSTFSMNTKSAVYNNAGTVSITDSVFTSNSNNIAGGGGVYDSGGLTITGSTFSGNTTTVSGGGVYSNAGLLITGSTFYNNSASNDGGGVYSNLDGYIANSTFASNSAGEGGGLYHASGNLAITNSTFSSNSSSTSTGGGIHVYGDLKLNNTILANSTAGQDCYRNIGASVIIGGHNLIETDSAGDNACGTIAPITSDPNLGLLTITGSPAYFPLNTGSLAIGAGNNTICAAPPVNNTSQNGVTRPQGANCDIGSVEKLLVYTFADVPLDHLYLQDIEILYANGLTAGCSVSPLNFCPDQIMTRAESSVFMLRGNFGTSYVPPIAPWDTFSDNWLLGAWAEKWAEGMYAAGFTAGCVPSPLQYCPWDQTPRVQAAVFGLKLKYGNAYVPLAATGNVFADMTDTSFWGTKWAEQAYANGLLPNCGIDIPTGKPLFCPNNLVSRGLAAYMIVKAKTLSMP